MTYKPDPNYFYSAKYLNNKFDSSLTRDLNKEKICDAIESQTGNETNFITIIGVTDENLEVEYSYFNFGQRETENVTLDIADCS